jgi:hypothetical protein
MANYPKKMKDPTEAALSAIQDALNIRDADAPTPAISVDPIEDTEPRRRGKRSQVDDDLFIDSAPAARETDTAPRRAANDDQQSIGQILQAVQRRPARTSYAVAAMLALVWVVATLGLGWAYLPAPATAFSATGGLPVLIGFAAVMLLPIIFFFALAHMVWRSQELRVIAQSMAQVAIRLAEPETIARESIVTVGQAIRREVAAMGDGVERALARAAELEALVANEVAALERAYNDNEVRIRGLLQDLASQRETLVGQAEQVRAAITSVHLDLTHDITTVSERVSDQISEAAARIGHSLAEKGEHITLALGHAGDSMIGALGERGGDLLERLEAADRKSQLQDRPHQRRVRRTRRQHANADVVAARRRHR